MSFPSGFETALVAMKLGRTVYKQDCPDKHYTINEPMRQVLVSYTHCPGRKQDVHTFDFEDVIYNKWIII